MKRNTEFDQQRRMVKPAAALAQGRGQLPGRCAVAVAATLGALAFTACGALSNVTTPLVNPLNDAVSAIDSAVSAINADSGSWQGVLQNSLKQLTSDAQSTVRNELQTLLESSIAAAQVGVMCTTDFVGRRVVTALERIKAALLGQPVPTPSPFICSSAPLAVEFAAWQQSRVPVVTLTGFDLNAPLQVALVQTSGTSVVPNVLADVSPYQATINLGATGLHLTSQSQRIVVSIAGQPAVDLSAINVVQPQARICEERDLPPTTPGPIGFVPKVHNRGDNEFSGHGPHITARLQIVPAGAKLNYTITMTATETVDDFTTVSGTGSGTLSLNPPIPAGVRIVSINGPTTSDADYVDQDQNDDHVRPRNGGPVAEFVFIGDTDGDDVGVTRLKSASFNPIGLHVIETQNCVTKAEAKVLVKNSK